MDIHAKYRQFLREYVDKKYLQHQKNVTVLGENFVDNYYVVLFEIQEDSLYHPMPETHRFILVENVGSPLIAELKLVPNSDGYVTMNKANLSNIVGKKLYRKFANRGIAMTTEIGLRLNNRFCWHRLVACLYYCDCLENEIHHINEDITDNNINNLIPLKKSEHNIIKKDKAHGRNFAIGIQEQEKAKAFKKKRETVASNDELILDVIELSMCGYTVNKIIKKFNKRIQKSSIYKIIKKIYYKKEFVFWLQNQSLPAWGQLNGNYIDRWCKIIKFEEL